MFTCFFSLFSPLFSNNTNIQIALLSIPMHVRNSPQVPNYLNRKKVKNIYEEKNEIDILIESIVSTQFVKKNNNLSTDTIIDIGTHLQPVAKKKQTSPVMSVNTYFTDLIMKKERKKYPDEKFLWPTKGVHISSAYGFRRDPFNPKRKEFHKGIDISGETGDDIFASKSGIVSYSGLQKDYGYVVIIRHKDNIYTLYAHNSILKVRKGDSVIQGQVIAKMGRTGRATGSHLHFEIRKNTDRMDPMAFFRSQLATRK